MVLLTSRVPTLNRSSIFLPKWPHSQKWNRINSSRTACLCKTEGDIVSASNVSGSARSWNVLVKMTSPQPQGPMAQDHLMTTETHDEDLMLSPAPKMNNHGLPFYNDSHANNTSKGLPSGSSPSVKNQTCQTTTSLSEFHCKSRFRVDQAF